MARSWQSELDSLLAKREGKRKQVSIGNVRELRKLLMVTLGEWREAVDNNKYDLFVEACSEEYCKARRAAERAARKVKP